LMPRLGLVFLVGLHGCESQGDPSAVAEPLSAGPAQAKNVALIRFTGGSY
jgi:hypothetical protein